MGVAALCSDAGKVNEELRLGVSGGTSLDEVGPCWFPSSLDELGPGRATTGPKGSRVNSYTPEKVINAVYAFVVLLRGA